MTRPLLRSELSALTVYQPEEGDAAVLLDANESPFSLPNLLRQKAALLLQELNFNRYPDPGAKILRRAAAQTYGVHADQVLPGNGSDELIQLLFTAFGGDGARLLVPEPTFSMYALCARAQGWQVETAPLDQKFDLSADFVAAAKKIKPRMIILASPNNPTGNCFDAAFVRQLLSLRQCLVVVDEAYAEFCKKSFIGEVDQRDNLVVLRTLSKAYGLAALRVGFLLGPQDLLQELEKVRLPYNVNAVSQALGAIALEQSSLFDETRFQILEQRRRLEQALLQAGFELYPSEANFVLAKHSQVVKIKIHLLTAGIRVRSFSSGRLENCLRISAGTKDETSAVLAVLKKKVN